MLAILLALLVALAASDAVGLQLPTIGRDSSGNLLVNTSATATLLLNGQAVATCNCTVIQAQMAAVCWGEGRRGGEGERRLFLWSIMFRAPHD